MTKFAKLDAPAVSRERPVPALRAASAPRPGRPASEAAAPPQIDNALVAELESALQAVVTHAPRPPAAERPEGEAPPPEAIRREQALEDVRPDAAVGASEPAPPPSLLVRPAAALEPARPISWEVEASAGERRPGADEPRRRSLPLRAALCVAVLLGLAGAGGTALILAGPHFPGNEFEGPIAKQVRTETIRATVAPAAMDPQPQAAGRETASDNPIVTGAPAGRAAGETPAGEVTLLRPVGGSRSGVAAEFPASREQPQAAGAAEPVKAPDRLIEAPAPTAAARPAEQSAGEAPTGGADTAAAESRLPTLSDTAAPAGGAGERLSGAPSPAAVAAVPTPLAGEELVARTGPGDGNGSSAADARADSAESPQPEMALRAADGEAGPAAGAATAGEPTRSAAVTSAVNMRAGPDNDAAVLAVVPAGSEIEVIACEHWCEVVFGGERGWIYRSFIGGA